MSNLYEKITADENLAYGSHSYAATRVTSGLYLQLADDGTTLFVIAKLSDGAAAGLDPTMYPEWFDYWSWGRVDRAIFDRPSTKDDLAELIVQLRDYARGGGWYRTKRDATAAALYRTGGKGGK